MLRFRCRTCDTGRHTVGILCITSTFRSKNYIEGQQGALGFQYFLLLPALLLLLFRRNAPPRVLVLFGLAGAVITFVSVPNLRYLYPALPLISIGIAWVLAEVPLMILPAVAMLGLNVWFTPASGWYHSDFALFNRAQFDDYLSGAAPQRKLIDVVNRTAPGEPVAFLAGDAIAGLRAKAYTDTWHTFKFWKRITTATEPGQIAALFRETGIHDVITPIPPETDFLPIQHFVEQWTAPAGVSSGRFELRTVWPRRSPSHGIRHLRPQEATTISISASNTARVGCMTLNSSRPPAGPLLTPTGRGTVSVLLQRHFHTVRLYDRVKPWNRGGFDRSEDPRSREPLLQGN